MISFVSLFVFIVVSNNQIAAPESVDFDQEHDKILAVVDDVFITMRINENFKKFKNVTDYMLIHNYIQEVVADRNKKYKEMYNLTKTTASRKIADYVSNINKAIDEMIIEHRVTNTDLLFDNNYSSSATSDDVMTDFFSLAKQLSLNLNITKIINPFKDHGIEKNVDTRRVFAGTKAESRDFPFVVSISIAGEYVCAGSIIRQDLVISAATCFKTFYKKDAKAKKRMQFKKKNIRIRAGSDFSNKGGVTVRVVMLHFHYKFDLEQRSNNLVILQLKLKLRLKRRVIQSIKMPRISRRRYYNVHLLGWGKNIAESKTASESSEFVRVTHDPGLRRQNRRSFDNDMGIEDRQIQHYMMDSYRTKDCKSFYGNATGYNITSRHFCAGTVLHGSGACKGDIGGPGAMLYKDIGFVLEGVVSYGPSRCGLNKAPTVFTRMIRYARWVDKMFCRIDLTKDEVEDSGQMEGLLKLGPDGKQIRRYPFVASVFCMKEYVCTGAIIRKELVVTVGSCLKQFDFLDIRRRITFKTNVEVRVGSDLLNRGTLIPVIKFHFHEKFDHDTLQFNVVILVLRDQIEFIKGETAGVHVSYNINLKTKYKRIPVVGWGTHCPVSKTAPRKAPGLLLRSRLLNTTKYRPCRTSYQNDPETTFNVTRLHHCVLTGSWGDDGLGNLVLVKNRLFGLVSVDCSRRSANAPTVFIKLAVISRWINSIMCRYKERSDPSDMSKVSDYGSIENVSSAEMVFLKGPKIECWLRSGGSLNCWCMNITTYYCWKAGRYIKHGTPIVCKDLDQYTKVVCSPANETEKDRSDISLSLVWWPRGPEHKGAMYYCELVSRNTSVRGCNETRHIFSLIPNENCHETNCSENIYDNIIYCSYRSCFQRWWPYTGKYCAAKDEYCLDQQRRRILCPIDGYTCHWYRNSWHHTCRFKRCKQKVITHYSKQKHLTICYYEVYCYFYAWAFYDCPETSEKKCIKIDGTWACKRRFCSIPPQRHRVKTCRAPGSTYCLDDYYNRYITCPKYTETTCHKLHNYLYTAPYICRDEYCPISLLLGERLECESKVYCYAIIKGKKETITCPKIGKNCRELPADTYVPTPEVDDFDYSPTTHEPTTIETNTTDTADATNYQSKKTTISNKPMICAIATSCSTLEDVIVDCTFTPPYCQKGNLVFECPPLDPSSASAEVFHHTTRGPRTLPADSPFHVRANDNDADDDFDNDDNLKLTTFASPRRLQSDVPWPDDDDAESVLESMRYASPRQIQTDVPALRARVDNDDVNLDEEDDLELTAYASPKQIQADAPVLRAQADDNDDNPDEEDDLELTAYASPRQIQTDVLALRARDDDDDVDGNPDEEEDFELPAYASPRQIQADAPVLRARADDNDDNPDEENDFELKTYTSPRQIQTDVPALRARDDDDDVDGNPDEEEDFELPAYASPKQIQVGAPVLRARADDNDDNPDEEDDFELKTYTSPRRIQTDVPALSARDDDDDVDGDGNPDEEEDFELPAYASPKQTQVDAPVLRARADDNDDNPDEEDDFELKTYTSPRRIQTDVPALSARDDDDADDNPAKEEDFELTTYGSPRQIQPDAPVLRAWADDNHDNPDEEDDFEWTTYANPRQIKTDLPALRAQDDDDDADGNPDEEDDFELTTYASPRPIQADAPVLRAQDDDDDADDNPDEEDDFELPAYTSPRPIQTDVPALRAQDDADDNPNEEDDFKLTTYASPRQIQADVPALTPQDDDADDNPDEEDDFELTTYASPRQIQADVPALRAQDDHDDADDNPDEEDDIELTTYASPRQIQADVPALTPQDDDADDNPDEEDDFELTRNASPRQIQTDLPALTAQDDDDANGNPDEEDDFELTTYASPRQIQTDVSALRAQDDDDTDDDSDKDDKAR